MPRASTELGQRWLRCVGKFWFRSERCACSQNACRSLPQSGQIRPVWLYPCASWPELGYIWSDVRKFGPPNLARNRSMLGGSRPELVRFGPSSAQVGPESIGLGPDSARGPNSNTFGQSLPGIGPSLARNRPNSGRTRIEFGQSRRKVDQIRATLGGGTMTTLERFLSKGA